MKNNTVLYIGILLLKTIAARDCDKCVYKEECPEYEHLNQATQDALKINFPCLQFQGIENKGLNTALIDNGDYVCCSKVAIEIFGSTDKNINSNNTLDYNNNYSNLNKYDENNRIDYSNTNPRTTNHYNFKNNSPMNDNERGSGQLQNNEGYNNDVKFNNLYNPEHPTNGTPNTTLPSRNSFNNKPYEQSSPFSSANGLSINGIVTQVGQCPTINFPPEPGSGCCGREASDSDRIIGYQPRPTVNPALTNNRTWSPSISIIKALDQRSWPTMMSGFYNSGLGLNRIRRSANKNINVTIDDRIAGGHETELEQFPWTVLLIVTYDYGNMSMSFDCGGALISSKYVLTAGHCVYDEGRTVLSLDVYLAEYDKRTFPKDCKYILGQGQKCIENIIIKADGIILHPQFDAEQLQNDIALIRLQENAPYTYYIRPICLPSIDIDSPEYSNLRLAVAGWGQNGRYKSDVKQSTVVNLVPQQKCAAYYLKLSRRNLCAAGYSGEDTCKGDSGGPLMTVYGGKYEIIGIVSGKRADSPCGTSIPSLYTNVYQYLNWIKANIKN